MSEIKTVSLGQKQCHSLKTWPEFFCHIITNAKRFEIRKDDRGFMAGDFVVLREWDQTNQAYTGRLAVRRIGYVLTSESFPGLRDGYVAFSLSEVSGDERLGVLAAFGRGEA